MPSGNKNLFISERLLGKLQQWFHRPLRSERSTIHSVEPQYWQEVRELMSQLHQFVKEHTIEDDNVRRINKRIVDYVGEQIHVKGLNPDISARYTSLQTLADRILVYYQSRFLGLKNTTQPKAVFTETVQRFKRRLAQRETEELKRQ